ncbi:MAG TPA: LLM class flavin-dependent oxidoreductase [Candidatus Binatia bacterium]|jgi:5,10-methylenetetrahydromethanopterin reductase|nr:LLM class flavin-dependent oxidoreductase [Candidatus Binatia bacterium]
MEIKLGLGVHWLEEDSRDDLLALVQDAERYGYNQIWISNEKFFRDMYVTATLIAENTTRPQIGTFVVDPYTHHPALTAMAVGTLDEVSRGRAILGIGAGGTGFPVMGIQRVKPAQAIREAVEVIRRLWCGETVDFQGEVIEVNNGRLNVTPPRTDIPIIIATRGNLVLQTAGEIADGVMIATYAEPVGLAHALDMVREGAKKAGRSLDDFTIISRVDACISQDRRAAYDAVKPMVGVFLWTSYPDRQFVRRVGLQVPDNVEAIIARRDYNLMVENAHLIPDEFVDKFCWAGTPEEVAHKVAAVARMGIDHITFLPHAPHSGHVRETVREFALTVKPLVEEIVG